MNGKIKTISTANKISILLLILFIVACVSVCAENKTVSTEITTESDNNKNKEKRDKLVSLAKSLEGKPYRYGAYGPNYFDCSGFVYYVARTSIGKQLPRTASAIYDFCNPITDGELEPGDLVFFKTTDSGRISHVGIYLGNKSFISALSDSSPSGVYIRSFSSGYWKNAYCGAARFIPSGEPVVEKKALGSAKTQRSGLVAYLADGCTCTQECTPCSLLW